MNPRGFRDVVILCITSLLLLIPVAGAAYDVVSNISSNSTEYTTSASYGELHNISLATGTGTTFLAASWDARVNFTAPLYGRFMRDGVSFGRFNLTQNVYATVGSYQISFAETTGTHYYGWEVYSNRKGSIYTRNFSAFFLADGEFATYNATYDAYQASITALQNNDTADRAYVNDTFLPISTYSGNFPNTTLASKEATWDAKTTLAGVNSSVDTWKSQSFQNLLKNGDFESWSAGASATPNGWTSTSGSIVISREATIKKIKTYSLRLVQIGGDGAAVKSNDIAATLGTHIQSRTFTAGVWIYTDAPTSRIGVEGNNSGWTYSPYHTGDSTWQFLTITATASATDTVFRLGLCQDAGTITAYFDGAILVEGSVIPAFSSHPNDWMMNDPFANRNQSQILYTGLSSGVSGGYNITGFNVNVSTATGVLPNASIPLSAVKVTTYNGNFPNTTIASKEAIWDAKLSSESDPLWAANYTGAYAKNTANGIPALGDVGNLLIDRNEVGEFHIMERISSEQAIRFSRAASNNFIGSIMESGSWRTINTNNASTINRGTLADARIASAGTWNGTTTTVNNNLANWNATYNVTYDSKEPAIAAGTASQYWNGLKQWITLGIGNITGLQGLEDTQNTSIDANTNTIAGNLAAWNATYNATYDATTATVNGNLANWNATYNSSYAYGGFDVLFTNGPSVLAAGTKAHVKAKYAGVLTDLTAHSVETGSINISAYNLTLGTYIGSVVITAGTDGNTTGLSYAFAKGDWLNLTVSSVTDIKQVTAAVQTVRS